MKDILSTLNSLCRPRLLIRAARLGQIDYRRQCDLPRHLGYGRLPSNGEALMLLLDQERDINQQRKNGHAGYSPAHHVDLMIAIMGEAHLLRQAGLE